jgi:antitoxin component of MazEF toxin-antitoxin module
MYLKIIKNGSSYMVTIPQAIINKLKWNETTKVFINLDTISGKIIIEKE